MMKTKRTYDWPDKALLLASRTIWDSFRQHYADISIQRPYWSPEYVEKISRLIDQTLTDYEQHGPTPKVIEGMNQIHYVLYGACNVCSEIFDEMPWIKKQFSFDAIVAEFN